MNTEKDLIIACKNNVFPSIHTMSLYGLNGEGKASPIDIFECYKVLIKENIYINPKNINNILERCKSLQNKKFYQRVKRNGGIKISDQSIKECSKCFYNGIFPTCCQST